jgi:hypothetical protein
MRVPKIVQKASTERLRYFGNYQGREVYVRIPPEEDDGSCTGLPFIFLYDGKQVEKVSVGIDENLESWFFDNA